MSGFIEDHELWDSQQREVAQGIRAAIESGRYRKIRVSVADPRGLLRSKTALPGHFLELLRDGMEMTSALFSFDSGEQIVGDPFGPPADDISTQLSGMRDVVLVPDPNTFVELPWSPGTAWVLGDMYSLDGTPVVLDARHLLKAVLSNLPSGLHYQVGLEIEFYLTGVREIVGAPAWPDGAERVQPLTPGKFYQSEDHQDRLDEWIDEVIDHAGRLGMPLRTLESELGPGQLEATFSPQSALAAADTAVLFRSMIKQVSTRRGLHATFMAVPLVSGFSPSGWHLHQSLTDDAGRNLFMPEGRSSHVLAPFGQHFLGGLLRHAGAASVFTTPTVNGYRRRGASSLAPTRSSWGDDDRSVMCRVRARRGYRRSRIENRIGEPAANPYLYMASQLVSGLDGVRNAIDPGPPAGAVDRLATPALPHSLAESLEALSGSTFFRQQFGTEFVEWTLRVKRSEVARFEQATAAAAEQSRAAAAAWEHAEYFMRC